MESPTSFDLNAAIGRWRDAIGSSGTMGREALEELEGHLRDSIEDLARRGLSVEESYLVAGRRLGGCRELVEEFGKVDPGAVWVDRALWAVAGVLGFGLLNTVAQLVSVLAVAGSSGVVQDARVLGVIGVAVLMAALGGGIGWLWRQARSGARQEWLSRLGQWAVGRPATAVAVVAVGTLTWRLMYGLAAALIPWRLGPGDFGTFVWISQAGSFALWLAPVFALGWLLRRRRIEPTASRSTIR